MLKIFHPSVYQGPETSKKISHNYFEGWYYKFEDTTKDLSVAVIPGIYLGGENPHSFIHFFIRIGKKYDYIYLTFSPESFQSENKDFRIQIGNNSFSNKEIILDHDQINCFLKFSKIKPWPLDLFSPSAMGWFSYIPFMEDFHHIISMKHEIIGNIQFQNLNFLISNGSGYIEKDRGSSFPESWIWLQCNNFSEKSLSLSLSVAVIPFFGKKFNGLLCGLYYQNHFYKFCTYNHTVIKKIRYSEDHKSVQIVLQKGRYQLKVHAKQGKTTSLKAPDTAGMNSSVDESLNASIEMIELTKHSQTVFKSSGVFAGMEIKGALFP